MNTTPLPDQERTELAAWRNGPWVLKRDHDKMVQRLREQLDKALIALAEMHAERIKERKSA
jgi:hypothetical protein